MPSRISRPSYIWATKLQAHHVWHLADNGAAVVPRLCLGTFHGASIRNEKYVVSSHRWKDIIVIAFWSDTSLGDPENAYVIELSFTWVIYIQVLPSSFPSWSNEVVNSLSQLVRNIPAPLAPCKFGLRSTNIPFRRSRWSSCVSQGRDTNLTRVLGDGV